MIIFNHFLFRIKQCLRILNLNPNFSVPVLLLYLIFVFVKIPDYFFQLLIFAVVSVFHFGRKDIAFLKKVFYTNWRLILFIESAFIYAVLLVSNIHYHVDIVGIIGFFGIISFAFFYPDFSGTKYIFQWNFIPDNLFEWKSFFRKNTFFVIFGYVLFLFSAYYPATLFFYGFFAFGCFSMIFRYNESKEMLEVYFQKVSFYRKIKDNLTFMNLLFLPVYLLFIIFNSEGFLYYLIGYFIFLNLYFLLIISYKYKIYTHKYCEIHYDIITDLVYVFCSLTVIPAVFVISSNINQAKQNIIKYVGNQ